jgi:hypothetical protein
MKRAGMLLLALALLGALAAPTQAAQPAKAKAVGQSRAEVVRYWTAERMRSAISLDVVKGADRKRPKGFPFTRYEPATYNPAHGKVFFSSGSTNYVCSGTALTSGNESVVWTAGHCVNPATMGIGCDMTGGSSGGGWVVGNTVLSVTSYGYSNQPNVLYGPYQDSVAQQLYASAAGS